MTELEIAPGVFYQFKIDPYNHQLNETKNYSIPFRACFWEQGTGKSKLTIDIACILYQLGLIDCVVVVAPNGVHRNWVESEIPDHLPESYWAFSKVLHFQTQRAGTKWHKKAVKNLINHKGFAWFTISYEAFMTKVGKNALIDLFDKRKVFYVLDESHYIKNSKSARTKSILKSAKYAVARRILTGTPISQGPFDIFSQIMFLDELYWRKAGFSTFAEFRAFFGVFRKVWNPNITHRYNPVTRRREKCNGNFVEILDHYKNLDKLQELLLPISSRVVKDDVLDLPPKVYTKRYFTMSSEQSQLYKNMRDNFIVWLNTEGKELAENKMEGVIPDKDCAACNNTREVNLEGYIYPCPDCLMSPAIFDQVAEGTPIIANEAIIRLIRLQQIACGYIPNQEDEEEPFYDIPGENKRLELLMEIIEASQGKLIVWARFQRDITLIIEKLNSLGIKSVRYDGMVSQDKRAEAKALFQGERSVLKNGEVVGRESIPEDQQAKVFVANPAAGATGLTLTKAQTVVYYSNSFKLIERLQSEDRAHRIGQNNKVLYIDLIAEETLDEKIVHALRHKLNIANEIIGDKYKEWL